MICARFAHQRQARWRICWRDLIEIRMLRIFGRKIFEIRKIFNLTSGHHKQGCITQMSNLKQPATRIGNNDSYGVRNTHRPHLSDAHLNDKDIHELVMWLNYISWLCDLYCGMLKQKWPVSYLCQRCTNSGAIILSLNFSAAGGCLDWM